MKKVYSELTSSQTNATQRPLAKLLSVCQAPWAAKSAGASGVITHLKAASLPPEVGGMVFSKVHNLSPLGRGNDNRHRASTKPWELMTNEDNLVRKMKKITETF